MMINASARLPASPRTALTLSIVLAVAVAAECASPVQAADIFWNGGFNNSWQQEFNWDPFGFPFSIHRVPTDLDSVIISTPFDDDISLFGDTAPVNGFTLSNDITLRTNGHKLTVDDGGAAQVEVSGAGTLLSIEKITGNSGATSFDADNLRVSGGRASIVGVANVDGTLDIRGTGEVSTAAGATVTVGRLFMAPSLFSSGLLDLFGVTTFHSTGAAQNTIGAFGSSTFNVTGSSTATFDGPLAIGGVAGDPTVNVMTGGRLMVGSLHIGGSSASTDTEVNIYGTGSRIEQRHGETLTIGGDADDGSVIVRIADNGRLRAGNGGTTINETGWVAMFAPGFGDPGSFEAFGDVLIDGGRLSGSGGSTFVLIQGRDLTVQNGGRFEIDTNLALGAASEISVSDSTFAIEPDGTGDALGVGIGVDDVVVTASGSATNFDIDGTLSIGEDGGTGAVTLSNEAQAFFRFLRMGASGTVDSHGTLTVNFGADVSMFGSAQIFGQGQGSTSHVSVFGPGSTFTMGSNASVNVGNAAGSGHASVEVLNGGVLALNSGGGEIHVRSNGEVEVTNARIDSAGSDGYVNEGLLRLGAFGFVNLTNGGGFDNSGGTVSGVGVIDLDGQIFDNGGGTLIPGSSAGRLTLRDATFVSDASSLIDIELGGLARGQFDELSIGGAATFDGTLRVTLIDGFVPQMGDSFDIISTLSVAGGFDTLICDACLGREFGILFGNGTVSLAVTAVPLPPSALLLLAALPGMLARRRQPRGRPENPAWRGAAGGSGSATACRDR